VRESTIRWTVSVVATIGAVACAVIGLRWLALALRPHVPAAAGLTAEPALAMAGAASLLLATGAAAIGAASVHGGDPRPATTLLLAAGLLPGLIDPRAFVVTWICCLAGLLGTSLPARRSGRPRVVAPSEAEVSVG
jgi:hypothetical protein